MSGYPNLAKDFGWACGVHAAPVGYGNPWLVVTEKGTVGAWSRAEARRIWARYKQSGSLGYATA